MTILILQDDMPPRILKALHFVQVDDYFVVMQDRVVGNLDHFVVMQDLVVETDGRPSVPVVRPSVPV